jgi:hypothetical protein
MMKFIMFMEDKDLENKTPSKMARLAWPKAKYGAIIAVIIIIVVNILFYWETITSFFK